MSPSPTPAFPAAANNFKFYWTLLDPSRTAASQIPITSANTMLTGLNPLSTISTPFMIGNDGRNRNSNFIGLVDEVRISKTERNALQMLFASSALSIITQPTSQTVAAGEKVTLTSLASGGAPRYQWQFHGTNPPAPPIRIWRSPTSPSNKKAPTASSFPSVPPASPATSPR